MEKQEFITTIGENDNVPQLDESSTDVGYIYSYDSYILRFLNLHKI